MKEESLYYVPAVKQERFLKKGFNSNCKNSWGNVIIDLVGKANGRGAYLKKDVAVIEAARKSHVLDKKLEVSVPDEIYDELKEVING